MSEDDRGFDLDAQLADAGPEAEGEPDQPDETGGADEAPERLDDLEARVTELELEEKRDTELQAMQDGPEIFDKVFPATVATDRTFAELVSLGGTLTTFIDGRTGSVIALAAGQKILIEVLDPGTGTQSASFKFIEISGGGDGTPSIVLVKANGVDGDGYPLYDLYAQSDVGLVTKLNLSGAIAPQRTRWRGATGLDVTAAPDGSEADAYFSTTGTIKLAHVAETVCAGTSSLTVSAGAV